MSKSRFCAIKSDIIHHIASSTLSCPKTEIAISGNAEMAILIVLSVKQTRYFLLFMALVISSQPMANLTNVGTLRVQHSFSPHRNG